MYYVLCTNYLWFPMLTTGSLLCAVFFSVLGPCLCPILHAHRSLFWSVWMRCTAHAQITCSVVFHFLFTRHFVPCVRHANNLNRQCRLGSEPLQFLLVDCRLSACNRQSAARAESHSSCLDCGLAVSRRLLQVLQRELEPTLCLPECVAPPTVSVERVSSGLYR